MKLDLTPLKDSFVYGIDISDQYFKLLSKIPDCVLNQVLEDVVSSSGLHFEITPNSKSSIGRIFDDGGRTQFIVVLRDHRLACSFSSRCVGFPFHDIMRAREMFMDNLVLRDTLGLDGNLSNVLVYDKSIHKINRNGRRWDLEWLPMTTIGSMNTIVRYNFDDGFIEVVKSRRTNCFAIPI